MPTVRPSQQWRARSAQLHAVRGRVREHRVSELFAVPCPVSSCRAPVAVPCNMGVAVPVLLVRKNPVAFCHIARVRDAVHAGTARQEEVLAQFTDKVDNEGVQSSLKEQEGDTS